MFTREELQNIRDKALEEAHCDGVAPSWRQAYFHLANSADHLDAMLARTIFYTVESIGGAQSEPIYPVK